MWIQSVYYLSAGPGSFRRKLFYIAYGGVLLVLITISTAANLFYGEAMWIEHRDVPGGPAAYFSENEALWYNTLGTATDVTANVLGDGLMVCKFSPLRIQRRTNNPDSFTAAILFGIQILGSYYSRA